MVSGQDPDADPEGAKGGDRSPRVGAELVADARDTAHSPVHRDEHGAQPLGGARRLRGVIRRNLVFSLLYNAVAAALALAGLVTPLLAALLMPCSSLIVVLSSALTPTFKDA